MTVFVVLLRAVNVGGTGKLPMSELVAMCEAAGFNAVRTYIASGNVVLSGGNQSEAKVKAALSSALEAYVGKPVGVFVRTAAEIAGILANNPFPEAPPHKTMAFFLDEGPPADVADTVSGRTNEDVRAGAREVYVHYPDGQGRSKLKIPCAARGTARNMNTVAKLAAVAAEI